MEKVLYKTEGAEEAAYPSAEHNAVQKENAEYVVGYGPSRAGERILQRAERARAHSAGAGIAVETGGAYRFKVALIHILYNVARNISLEMRVREERGVKLYKAALRRDERGEPFL